MIRDDDENFGLTELCLTICIAAVLIFGPGLFLGWLFWG